MQPVALYTKTGISSGAGLFAQELAHGIVDAGGAVVFVAPPAENPRYDQPRPGLRRIASRAEQRHGPKWRRAASSILRMATGALGCLRARALTRTFIVTIPDPLVFALPLLAVLRLTGARIIYVVHDPVPHSWKLPPALRSVENGAFALAYRLSSALVVLSEAGAATLHGAYAVGSRPVVVIEHGTFALSAPSPAPGTGDLLLFGTLRRNKGVREAIEGVIEARARGCDVRLVVAGAPDPVEPDYWAGCEALARRHPEAVRLEIGYVSDERLEELLAAVDAMIMPYRDFASQSGVAMVAASNGRAIIAAPAGGIGDLIADGMAAQAIAQPVDAACVADAVVAFRARPVGEWNAAAMAYRDRIMATHAWPAIGARYLALRARLEQA
ncbi:glycosyltransferase family 4 protein [Sphingomonas sp. VNH70]|uniref:glycosyltransferase family 4 protein n=1 Tax=Sphingomonas silueang TaxID=3156617 RepID=UPI0032B45EF0